MVHNSIEALKPVKRIAFTRLAAEVFTAALILAAAIAIAVALAPQR